MLGHVIERMVAGQRTGYSFSPDTGTDSAGQCPPLPPFNRSQPGANGHEVFADEFALALLMPPHLLGRLPSDPWDAQEQAARLHVSPRALRRWHERLAQDPWNQRRIEEVVPVVEDAVRAARTVRD